MNAVFSENIWLILQTTVEYYWLSAFLKQKETNGVELLPKCAENKRQRSDLSVCANACVCERYSRGGKRYNSGTFSEEKTINRAFTTSRVQSDDCHLLFPKARSCCLATLCTKHCRLKDSTP